MQRLEPTDVTIHVNGADVPARAGEALSVVLMAAGLPLSFHCGMGVCFSCLVRLDSRPVRACLERVRAGMRVETAR